MAEHQNIKRNQAIWQSDFSASKSENGKWDAKHSFICHWQDAVSLTPKIGAPCQREGFEILGFKDASLADHDGEICRVNCHYVGTTFDLTAEFGEDNQPEPVYTLTLTLSTEPLETNPQYADVMTDEEKEVIALFKQGRIIIENVEGVRKFYRTLKTNKREEVTLGEEAQSCMGKIISGFVSYMSPRATWKAEYISKNPLSSSLIDKTGDIDLTPDGDPPTPDGRDWLSMGGTQKQEAGIYHISLEWMLSGKGGWDEIYEGSLF